MGHFVSQMAQCRCGQGVHKKDYSRWAGLQSIDPNRFQTRDRRMHDLVLTMNCCCQVEEVCVGYWLGFSVKKGRPLDHS